MANSLSEISKVTNEIASDDANPTLSPNFIESSDAGETLATATAVITNQMMALDSISGSLSGDADLFKIFLTGGQTFSATTANSETAQVPIDEALGIPTDLVVDPKIFLLDEQGNGVYANDDLFGSTQSTLISGPGGFSPETSGIYYLGISGTGYEAASADGQIFPGEPFDEITGPTGPGGRSPLTGFVGNTTASFGEYLISLTGAQTIAVAGNGSAGGNNGGNSNDPNARLSATDNNLIAISGTDSTRLSVSVNSQAARELGEVLVIATDNEQGDIDGLAPGSDGYLQAALGRATVLFSAFPAGGFEGLMPKRTLAVNGGQFLQLATVKDGSLADLLSGEGGELLFAIANANRNSQSAVTNRSSSTEGDLVLNLSLPGSSNNDLVLEFSQGNDAFIPLSTGTQRQGNDAESEIIDLTGLAGSSVTAAIEVFREASFDNTVGFYTIEDADGTVRDPLTGNLLKPGESGYQQAALANRVSLTLTGENGQTKQFSAELETGKLLSTFIVIDATVDDLLGGSSFDSDGVYFNHIGANTDGKDHVRLFGDNTFGYEDLAGGGDMDFDDVVVKVSFA